MHHLTITLPTPGSDQPTVFHDDATALTIAHLTRRQHLPRGWRTSLGAYLLLDTPDATRGTFRAYAGSAYSAGLGTRLPRQWGHHPWAQHAWVIRRDTHTGLTSPHAVALEDHLYAIGVAAPTCTLANQARPPRMPLPSHERHWLRELLNPLIALLADACYDLNPATAPVAVTIADLQRAGLVRQRELLHPRWKPGAVAPALLHGTLITWSGIEYDAARPSIPARAMRGGKPTNGWQYLAVDRSGTLIPLETLRLRISM